MSDQLSKYLNENYRDVKSDLFSAFIMRNLSLCLPGGQLGFMTPFVWMFISSYEKLRKHLIKNTCITTLVQLEYSGFDGATVPICTFTLANLKDPNYKGGYIKLSDFRGAENQAPRTMEATANPDCGWFYRSKTSDFTKIPGAPIAYWVNDKVLDLFQKAIIGESYEVGSGLSTSDNDRFLRFHWEVSKFDICRNPSANQTQSHEKWFRLHKGGEFRKWYGNSEHVVLWQNDGERIKHWVENNPNDPHTTHWSRRIFNTELYFKKGIVWSTISSGSISFRYSNDTAMISNASGGIFGFTDDSDLLSMISGLNTNLWRVIFLILNPTLNYSAGIIQKAPKPIEVSPTNAYEMVQLAMLDWDSYESSWDFQQLPLLGVRCQGLDIRECYAKLREQWIEDTLKMQELEEENNRIFIEAYGLQDELKPEVPLKEITLTCNPYYRYGVKEESDVSESGVREFPINEELEKRLV
ncbi:MAG TPA: hypothetical protein PLK07_09940, partial [Rectinema sp.]|nr:hypothetical protein [Rectinema sp.]